MGAAFAQVAGKCLSDLVLGRALCCREERGRLHDHAVDAVAALRRLFVDECLLHADAASRPCRDLPGSRFRRRPPPKPASRSCAAPRRSSAPCRRRTAPARNRSAGRAGRAGRAARTASGMLGSSAFRTTALPLTVSLMVVAMTPVNPFEAFRNATRDRRRLLSKIGRILRLSLCNFGHSTETCFRQAAHAIWWSASGALAEIA